MNDDEEYPYRAQGKRLRWLRQAERIPTGTAFAIKHGWPQSAYSMFETGRRAVPGPKIQQLVAQIAGFDPVWFWTGDKKGLSYDLRVRIEAEEAKDPKDGPAQLARGERQDV